MVMYLWLFIMMMHFVFIQKIPTQIFQVLSSSQSNTHLNIHFMSILSTKISPTSTSTAHCQVLRNKNNSQKLIIGGMSFIGSRLAVLFHNRKEKHLQVVEDIVNVDRDEMKWYRWTKLNERKGLSLYINDYSEVKHIMSLLNGESPVDIVYIPTILFDMVPVKSIQLLTALKNCVTLLNTVAKHYKKSIKITFILPQDSTWSNLFHYTLQSYSNTMCISVIQLSGVYGPWQDIVTKEQFEKSKATRLYIDDALTQILGESFVNKSVLNGNGKSNQNVASTLAWIKEYNDNKSKQIRTVALGGVLQRVGERYHRHTVNEINSGALFQYFKRWLMSADRVGIDTVIFSDIVSDDFKARATSHFKRTEFCQVKSLNHKSPNDQRFYMTYNYLLSHSDIEYATITDTSDVRFVNDPKIVMKSIGDYYFVGSDRSFWRKPTHPWMVRVLKQCFRGSPFLEKTLRLLGFFNCGVFGGSRTTVLNFLSHMIVLLEKADSRRVCDMAAVEVLSRFENIYELVYYGYPFNTDFWGHIEGPFGIAIKHKG